MKKATVGMSRKKGNGDVSMDDLYKEILKIKKESNHHKMLISSLLQRIMELELKLAEPKQEVLRLKTELMTLAASLDERFEKQSLLSTPMTEGKSYRFRDGAQQMVTCVRVANVLRTSVSERQQREEELREEEFQKTLSDLGEMLKILENIGRTLNVPGLPVEFIGKLCSSVHAISSVLEKE